MPNFQIGPQLARSSSQTAGDGTTILSWTNPQNVTLDDGTSFATVALSPETESTLVEGTNYGFTVPAGATILGAQFWVKRSSRFTQLLPAGVPTFPLVTDRLVMLVKGGALAGTDHADRTTFWPTALTQTTYGSQNDLWGTTLTPADVNASGFGMGISVVNRDPVGTLMSLTAMHGAVYYQEIGVTGGGFTSGRSLGGVTAFQRIALFPVTNGFYAFDPGNWLNIDPRQGETPAPAGAGFNDTVNDSFYTYRIEEIAVARKPTVSRLFVTYLDLGLVEVTFTLVACQDDQTVVTNSATVTLGNSTPTMTYLTKEVDLLLSGMNMQLSWSRAAGAGPLAISKIKMIGNVETEAYT